MSSEHVLWSLLHIQSKQQVDELSYAQMALLVASFNEHEWANWAAWYEGLPDWQPLEELLNMLNVKRGRARETDTAHQKPPPFHGAVSVNSNPSISVRSGTGVTHTASNILFEEGCVAKRFTKSYKVIYLVNGKMFETHTVDISLTGLQLTDSVPYGHDGQLEVTLINSRNEQLQLICSLIPDDHRNRLKIVRAGKLDLLQAWLLAR